VGEAGNDTIHGLDGDDRICGGQGDDTLIGGAKQDILDGGDGTDTCFVEEDDGHKAAGEESVVSCERPLYVLTVEVRCCLRFVTSEPGGISCPPDCSEAYSPGTVVTLTLSTGGNSGWRGCDQPNQPNGTNQGPTCTLTMTADRHVSV
jgi:Ca2+-binding RTX toxin-like protein